MPEHVSPCGHGPKQNKFALLSLLGKVFHQQNRNSIDMNFREVYHTFLWIFRWPFLFDSQLTWIISIDLWD